MAKAYWLGAPLTRKGIKKAVDDLSQHVPANEQIGVLGGYLNRNTDKTLGVLTVATIILAIAAMFLQRLEPTLVGVALVSCAIAVILLLSNLWTHWRRDNVQFRRTPEGAEHLLTLLASRVLRLSASTFLIMLSALALALAFAQHIYGFSVLDALGGVSLIDLLPRR